MISCGYNGVVFNSACGLVIQMCGPGWPCGMRLPPPLIAWAAPRLATRVPLFATTLDATPLIPSLPFSHHYQWGIEQEWYSMTRSTGFIFSNTLHAPQLGSALVNTALGRVLGKKWVPPLFGNIWLIPFVTNNDSYRSSNMVRIMQSCGDDGRAELGREMSEYAMREGRTGMGWKSVLASRESTEYAPPHAYLPCPIPTMPYTPFLLCLIP